jgi:nucleoid-associated protein YgaU
VRRLLGASALCLLFGRQLPGCSGDQQQADEAVEASEQGDNQSADNEAAASDNQAASDDAGGGEDQAATNNGGGAGGADNELNDLIQETNGQQPAADGAQAQVPVPTNATNAQAGALDPAAAAPVNTAAAAPAPAASTPNPIPFQPGGTPAANGLPELGSKMAYVVEKGDTMAKIAQKIYGNTKRWKELADLSEISNPSRIYPGDLVFYVLDEKAVAFATAYEAVGRSEEQVKPGDTLGTIAQRLYGSPTAWRAIWRQNAIDNPDVLPPGSTVMYLAKGASATALRNMKTDSTKLADDLGTKPTQKTVKPAGKTGNLTKITINGSMTLAKTVAAQTLALMDFVANA